MEFVTKRPFVNSTTKVVSVTIGAKEVDGETLSLISDMLQSLNKNEFLDDLIPVSNVTGEGMVNLESALSRIINLGEEVED